jgi:hypothetical protein
VGASNALYVGVPEREPLRRFQATAKLAPFLWQYEKCKEQR